MSLRILGSQALRACLSPIELLAGVEHAMLLYDRGEFSMPDRLHIDTGENTFLYMPALSRESASTKLISVIPSNPSRGLPSILGTVVLNNGATGEPLALFDAATLTALRTGAIAGVASRYLSPPDSSKLGVIGAGVQGIEGAISICTARPISEIFVHNRSLPPVRRFKEKIEQEFPKISIHIEDSSEAVLRNSQIIFTATNSVQPVLPDSAPLLKGKHFIAIGSYKPDMREWPDSLYSQFSTLYIDVHLGLKESGDLKHPVEKGWIKPQQIHTLGKLIENKQMDIQGTTAFKSVGMALFDLVVAQRAYEKAIENNLGVEVPFP